MLYRQGSLPLLFTQKLNLDILLLGHQSSSLQEEAAGLASHLSFCLVPSLPHPPAFLPLLSLLSGGEGKKAGKAGCCISLIHLPAPSQAVLSTPISLYTTHGTKGQTCISTPPWSRMGGFTLLFKSKFGNVSCISSSGNCNHQLSSKEKMIVIFLCPQKDSFMSAQGYQSLMIKMKSWEEVWSASLFKVILQLVECLHQFL